MTTTILLPPGIGDIAFVWCQLKHLPGVISGDVELSVPDHMLQYGRVG